MAVYDHIAIIVVSAADKAQANSDAQTAIHGCGTPFDSNVGASPNGSPAPSHHFCRWVCTADEYSKLQTAFNVAGRHFFDGTVTGITQALQSLSLIHVKSGGLP